MEIRSRPGGTGAVPSTIMNMKTLFLTRPSYDFLLTEVPDVLNALVRASGGKGYWSLEGVTYVNLSDELVANAVGYLPPSKKHAVHTVDISYADFLKESESR